MKTPWSSYTLLQANRRASFLFCTFKPLWSKSFGRRPNLAVFMTIQEFRNWIDLYLCCQVQLGFRNKSPPKCPRSKMGWLKQHWLCSLTTASTRQASFTTIYAHWSTSQLESASVNLDADNGATCFRFHFESRNCVLLFHLANANKQIPGPSGIGRVRQSVPNDLRPSLFKKDEYVPTPVFDGLHKLGEELKSV